MKHDYTSALARATFDQVRQLPGALFCETMHSVWFVSDGTCGFIRLWEGHIVEMEIPALGFWAHFDGDDAILFLDHIHAFFKALHRHDVRDNWLMQTSHPMKLLIICSSGLSSSVAAHAINEMATRHGWNIEADSCAAVFAPEKSREADVVLYAPQASAAFHQLPKEQRRRTGVIQPMDFAMMNPQAMVHQALQLAS